MADEHTDLLLLLILQLPLNLGGAYSPSCKRFKVGRPFKYYKALWKYKSSSLYVQQHHKFKSSFALPV